MATAVSDSKARLADRVWQARERVLQTRPSIDLERAQIFTQSFMTTEGEPLVIRRAKAFKEICQRRTIFIQDGELIVGTPGSRIRAGIICPEVCYQQLDEELDTISTRVQDPFLITEEQKKLFTELIRPYWKGKSLKDAWMARIPDNLRQLAVGTSIIDFSGKDENGPGELAAGYQWVLNSGINGIKKTIERRLASFAPAVPEHRDRITYLKALLIVCDGIITLARRYAELARVEAATETDRQRKAELEQIAGNCERVPANPARNFWEALQSCWLYHCCLHMDLKGSAYCPGRMDQYLYPYFKRDVEEGRLTRERAQDLLDLLWVKFAEIVSFYTRWSAIYYSGYMPFQNITLAGIDGKGKDAVNELSYMMVQAQMDVRLNQPTLSIRYNKEKNPDSFMHKVAELVSLGTGNPAIFNDEVGMKMVMGHGVSSDDARDWCVSGCVEPLVPAKLAYWSDGGHINLGATVELTLTRGVQRLTGLPRPLPDTGDPESFKTFAEFKSAVKDILAYQIKKMVEGGRILDQASRELRPVLAASLTYPECIEKGLDYQWGGPKYWSPPAIVLVGLADIANSLAAVKKLIYDEGKLTWDQLLEALDKDFDGYEEIRQMCLSAPKYGNDIEEVDRLAAEIARFVAEETGRYTGLSGAEIVCGLYPVTTHMPFGKALGALPSGRKAGQPLADGMSPNQGTDVKGPTAVFKSASAVDHAAHRAGTLLNMKLSPSLLKDEKGLMHFVSLLKAAFALGIYHVQFNAVSAETLKAAQKRPEQYRDLLVRVAGYSAYFVELRRDVQDDIIARTEHMSFA
ncbi:MAG: glycyl radical protein [Chloroflexi bacterium]|nr:glycyl radical protein [Chloroflexota bacterium]